jgi:ATP-binding cassette, subfamily B, bacterial
MKPSKHRTSEEFSGLFSDHGNMPWGAPSIRLVWCFIHALKKLSLAIILFQMLAVLFRVAEPYMAKILFEQSVDGTDTQYIIVVAGIWMSLYVMRTVFSYLGSKAEITFRARLTQIIRNSLFGHLIRLPLSYFHKSSVGYIMSRQIDDTDNLDGILVADAAHAFFALIEFSLILLIMLSINWILTAIMLIIFALDFRLQFAFPLRRAFAAYNECKARLSKELQQAVSGVRLVKSSAAIHTESERYSRYTGRHSQVRMLRDNMSNRRRGLTDFIRGLSNPLTILVGGYLVSEGTMTLGSLMAFLLYFGIARQDLGDIINAVPMYNTGKAFADRIWESFENIVEQDDGDVSFSSLSDVIEFRDVTFGYGDSTTAVCNLTFRVEKGQTAAIVGPSGSGKSTIANLLLRLHEPRSGSIQIDGIGVRQYKLSSIRSGIGYISQDPFLFTRSIAENITYGLDEPVPSNQEIWTALEIANARSFVEQLPNGIDTRVSDRGESLSGGEKQRICIAREVLKNPSIILLDEATSALDALSAKAVQTGLERAMEGRTVIAITHNISLARDADVIFVLSDGKIVQRGTHEELMESGGVYQDMATAQGIADVA